MKKKFSFKCQHTRQIFLSVFQNQCMDCGIKIGKLPRIKNREKELVKEVGGML